MSLNHNYVVYIVECSDGQYYTGMTNNLDKRLYEHNSGLHPTSFTHNRRPVVLRYFQYFSDVNQAIAWEKQLKGWSRKKKEALFDGDWKLIQELAKNREK